MEKERFSQLELFSNEYGQTASKKSHNPILNFILNYEKAVLIIIGFIITVIISFSLGVEKERRISLLKFNARFDLAQVQPKVLPSQAPRLTSAPAAKVNTQPAPITNTQPQAPLNIKEKGQLDLKKQETQEDLKKYTIQLASYQNQSHAQKEAKTLKQKGLSALIISKSGYAVLCVGKFSNKKAAQSSLADFRRRYRDCIVRRL